MYSTLEYTDALNTIVREIIGDNKSTDEADKIGKLQKLISELDLIKHQIVQLFYSYYENEDNLPPHIPLICIEYNRDDIEKIIYETIIESISDVDNFVYSPVNFIRTPRDTKEITYKYDKFIELHKLLMTHIYKIKQLIHNLKKMSSEYNTNSIDNAVTDLRNTMNDRIYDWLQNVQKCTTNNSDNNSLQTNVTVEQEGYAPEQYNIKEKSYDNNVNDGQSNMTINDIYDAKPHITYSLAQESTNTVHTAAEKIVDAYFTTYIVMLKNIDKKLNTYKTHITKMIKNKSHLITKYLPEAHQDIIREATKFTDEQQRDLSVHVNIITLFKAIINEFDNHRLSIIHKNKSTAEIRQQKTRLLRDMLGGDAYRMSALMFLNTMKIYGITIRELDDMIIEHISAKTGGGHRTRKKRRNTSHKTRKKIRHV